MAVYRKGAAWAVLVRFLSLVVLVAFGRVFEGVLNRFLALKTLVFVY